MCCMYTEKQFNIPTIEGISQEQIQVHLGLYSGYVKNTNKLREQIVTLQDEGADATQVAELQRRLGFEFNGMRMHEYYFEQLEGGAQELPQDSPFLSQVEKQFGSIDNYLADLRRVAGMRGIGWVVTSYDERSGDLLNVWVSDHELGQLAGNKVIFAMDMWEHAFMVDYLPATKSDYVSVYLAHVNWQVVADRMN